MDKKIFYDEKLVPTEMNKVKLDSKVCRKLRESKMTVGEFKSSLL